VVSAEQQHDKDLLELQQVQLELLLQIDQLDNRLHVQTRRLFWWLFILSLLLLCVTIIVWRLVL
jgi:hypothetical protein